MGIGTLRRHYPAAGVAAAKAAHPARGGRVSPETAAELEQAKADNAKLADKLKNAGEHVALWKSRALALGYVDAPEVPEVKTPEPERPEQTEAGEQPAEVIDPAEAERLAAMPQRSAKTAEWVAYAERFPLDPPIDLAARPGLRDEIAAAYKPE